MNRRIRFFVCGVLLALAIAPASHLSAQATQAAGTPNSPSNRPQNAAHVFAWGYRQAPAARGHAVVRSPVTLELDENGAVLHETPGIEIGYGAHAWRVETREQHTALKACRGAHHRATIRAVTLRRIAGTQYPEFIPLMAASREDLATASDYDQELQLLGQLGPYLFTQAKAASFECASPRAAIDTTFAIWDLRSGSRVDLDSLTHDWWRSMQATAAEWLRAAWNERNDGNRDAEPFQSDPSDVSLFSLRTEWRGDRAVLTCLATVGANWADTNMTPDNESFGVEHECVGLPVSFAAYGGIPRAIRNFLARESAVKIGGFDVR